MNFHRPIEIVGGGLAGLALGVALRRSGVEARVLEAGTYPRHRVCGEFITGLSAATRARLGLGPLLADAVRNRSVVWFARGRPIRRHRLPAPALSLSRHTLDARLAATFVALGGELCTRTRGPTVDAPGRVIATGRRPARSPWIGLKIHALGLPLAGDLELHPGDSAYVGLARLGGDRVNVCGLFLRRALRAQGVELLRDYLTAAGLHGLARRLGAAATDAASFCAVAAVAFDRAVPTSGTLRLGDAAAVIPPFTGHGMAMAFESAALALDPLLDYARGEADWSATRVQVHHLLRRRFRLRLASASLFHPFLLRPPRQRWLERLHGSRLLPLRPLYAMLHG